MNNVLINETPVRTAKNFGVNSFDINKDLIVSNNKITKFDNLKVISQSKKDNLVDEKIDSFDLTYGISKDLEKQVKEYANINRRIEINSKMDNEILLEFNFDDNNLVLVDNIEIVANIDTKSTIIIKYSSNTKKEIYHNGIIRVLVKENAKVNLIVANLLPINAINLVSIENEVNDFANCVNTIVDFGGLNSVSNNYFNITGKESNSRIDTIYLGKENQRFDLNYIMHIKGEKALGNIEVQGALSDTAKKVFKGTLDFKKGCKKSKADENEFCMLLSNKAKSLGLPMLLCSEEDVEGNHSSASGKAGEKEVFYLMTRGFSYKEAMKLLVRANFNKILDNIKNEELKDEILNEIDNRLD